MAFTYVARAHGGATGVGRFGSLLGEALEAQGMTDNDPADLRSFDAQLKAARERNPTPESRSKDGAGDRSGMAIGLRLSAELIAGLLFGLAVGWGLDRWLGTAPWLLLVFMLLGVAAGILNVIRAGNRANERADKE
jgi:ATP synthase protein I